MLEELRITDLGVIAEAAITFGPGLTVVSGETGAGKTMVVSGIDLITGSRASAGQVRTGADRLQVAATLTHPTASSVERLAEAGGELDDGALLLLRRTTAAGRTRFHAGGVPVPAATVAELIADELVIHGQSGQQQLARPGHQRDILDRAGGAELATARAEYRQVWLDHRERTAELADLRAAARDRAREIDLLRFGLNEIDEVAPDAEEDERLAAEQQRLQSIDDLRVAARTALTAVAGDVDGDPDTPDATMLLGEARRQLHGVEDAPAAALARRLDEINWLLTDVATELGSYLADLAADPQRLEWIAGRRADLARLTRKYGDTLPDVLAWADQARARLTELENADDRIVDLAAEVDRLAERLRSAADTLSELRRGAAEQLSSRVQEELAALAMPRATLQVAVTPLGEAGPWGADRVEILFGANPGQQPGPLAQVASGGELSRVRLALEVCQLNEHPPAMVFDEVDAGVGGRVATEIGRRLARLARAGQVIVVTHLAQVAVFADRHWVVRKSADETVTVSDVVEVIGDERVTELARMLSGEDSQTARAHAAELLSAANEQQS